MSAPLAWGCTTGDSAVSIGIVDEDFFDLQDVGETSPGQVGGSLFLHGTRVLSVLAARGDNQQGMAGMIWDFQRQEYNIANAKEGKYLPRSGVLRLLWKSIFDDHRVINLSLQARYIDSVRFIPRAPNPASHADSMHAIAVGDLTAGIIVAALLPGNDPLIVISAGNYGLDAFWGGYARAVRILPNRVIVVGAAKYVDFGQGDGGGRFKRAAWSTTPELDPDIGSNWGELVDVYAPGERVGALATFQGTDVLLRNNGTSLAAPIVTGIAGLMLSIDPTLTAAELKELIIRGGERGGRVVANGLASGAQYRYVANAYESLRAAAERPGAGLCGNPMYRDSTGTTFARRVVAGVSSWEPVFQEGWGGISPQHRRRQVRLSNGNTQLWRDGEWRLSATTDSADNATWLSRLGKSHDGDTAVTVEKRRVSQFQEEFDVKINGTLLTTVVGPPVNNPTGVSPKRCVAWDTNGTEFDSCYAEARNQPDLRTTTYSVSYSSARREVLLAVARDSMAWKVELAPFVWAGLWQRNYSDETYAIDTKLYFIPVDNPAAVRTAVSRGYRLSNVGFSDDGTHLVMRSASWLAINNHTPDETFSNTTKTCQAVYSRVFNYDLMHEDRSPDIVNGSTLLCYPDATFAP